MISGSKIRIERRLRAAAAAVALCLAGLSPAWALDLPELMGLLARQKSGEGRFTEQRYVRGIEGPLSSSGTLSFSAPDRMTRRTLSPRPESMAVEGNTLTLTRGNRTRTMTLDSMPELLGLVEAMRATLVGNSRSLERYFRGTVGGSAADWTLDLVPIDDKLAAQVRSLRLNGRQGEVLGVEMEFVGGDRSVMTITPDRGATPAPTAASTPAPTATPSPPDRGPAAAPRRAP